MRKKKRSDDTRATLEMTPMIDVVFQLLIFFIVTLKTPDIVAYVDPMRPQPDPRPSDKAEEPLTITIGWDASIKRDSIGYNGMRVLEPQLRTQLQRIARTNPNTTVVIKCTENSHHGTLVKVLDICNELNLRQLAVFSM